MGTPERKKTGPLPGTRHSGSFLKGGDPRQWHHNPEAQAVKREVEELCKEHAEKAVNFLATILGDDSAAPRSRLEAASQILDRGFGKAVDRIQIQAVGHTGASVGTLDLHTLRQQAQRILSPPGETIDSTCVNVMEGELVE